MKKKLIVAGAAVVVIAAIAVPKLLKKEPEVYESRPTVSVENPKQDDIVLYTEVTGTAEPQSQAAVMPKISGEVLEVYIQAGDHVTAGQPICQIDSDALKTLKLQLDAAEVGLRDAQSTLSRTQALYQDGYVSEENMEQVQNAADNAQISYESAKTQYDLQQSYTVVTSPIDGVIESRSVEPHDHVSPGGAVCVVSGQDQLQINFGVTGRIRDNMQVGDQVEIIKNGTSADGTVSEIGSMVNASTGLYDVKATTEKQEDLTSGMRVRLKVVMDQAKGALTIPLDAVSYDDGTPFVYCYENGTAVRKEFESGIYDGERMQVVSGLDAGANVITSWSNELTDGAEVLLENEASSETTQADGQVKSE